MYCRAMNVLSGMWFVVCDFVHELVIPYNFKIILAWCMALNGVLTNDLYTFSSVCMFSMLSHLVYKTSADYEAWH